MKFGSFFYSRRRGPSTRRRDGPRAARPLLQWPVATLSIVGVIGGLFGLWRAAQTGPAAPLSGMEPGGLAATGAAGEPDVLRIGVLANRGFEQAHREWDPTADYLSRELAPRRFEIVPLGFREVENAVRQRRVHFVVCPPTYYVILEKEGRAYRIATRYLPTETGGVSRLGGVVFVRADRRDLRGFESLRGRRLGAVDVATIGGYLAIKRELVRAGLEPDRDLAGFKFYGNSKSVVEAVLAGEVDAGTVRTGLLETLAEEGKLDLARIRVLGDRSRELDFPYRVSTALYPEWSFAAVRGLSPALRQQVAAALLRMPADGPVARAAGGFGWTVAEDYRDVHALLRELRLPPYDRPEPIRLDRLWAQYWPFFLASAALFVLLVVAATAASHLSQRNRALAERTAESESRYRTLAVQSRAVLWEADREGNLTFVSDELHDVLGYEPSEVLGRPVARAWRPESDGDAVEGLIDDLRDRPAGGRTVEGRALKKTGDEVWVSTSLLAKVGADGTIEGFRGWDRDVTARVEAHRSLQESNERLAEVLHEAEALAASLEETRDRLEQEHDALQTVLASSPVGLVVVDQEHRVLHANRILARWVGAETEDELIGRILGQALGCVHVSSEEPPFGAAACAFCMLRQAVRNAFVRGAEQAPFELRTRGAHGEGERIYEGHVTPIVIDQRDAALVSLLDVTERRRAEDKVREQRERLERILAGTRAGTWEWDLLGGTVLLDRRGAELLGLPCGAECSLPEEAFAMRLHPDDREAVEAEKRRCLEDFEMRFDVTARVGDDEAGWRWVHARGQVLARSDDGAPARMYGTMIDVTQRVEAQRDLAEREERLRSLFASLDDLVFVLDRDLRFVDFAATNTERLLLLPPEQFLGKRFDAVGLPEEVVRSVRRAIETVLSSGVVQRVEYAVQEGDRTSWFGCRLSPLYDQEKRIAGVTCVVRDVTNAKEAERRLHLEETRFRILVENSQAIVYTIGPSGHFTYVSPSWKRLLGHDPASVVGQHFLEFIHEEDREFTRSLFEQALRGRMPQEPIDYRVRRTDGTVAWHRSVVSPVYGDLGQIAYFVGNALDISRQVEAEISLREANEELEAALIESNEMAVREAQQAEELERQRCNLQTIFDSSPVGFMLVDGDAVVTRANRSAASATDSELEQLLGQRLGDGMGCDLRHPEKGCGYGERCRECEVRNLVVRVARSGKSAPGIQTQLHLRRGHELKRPWVQCAASPVEVEGERHVLLSLVDITEQRIAELTLREREESFRRLFERSSEPLLILRDGQIVSCNDAAVEALGYSSRSELFLVDPAEISPPTQPDGRSSAEAAAEMIAIARQKGHHRFDWVHLRKDGTPLEVEVMLTVIEFAGREHLHVAWRDVGEQHRMEKALRDSEHKFRTMFELSPVGMILNELDTGKYLDCNQAFLDMVGYTREELAQLSYSDLTPESYHEQDRVMLQVLLAEGRVGPFEKEYIRKDGSRITVLINALLMVDNVGRKTAWSLVQDITERKQHEAFMREHARQLRAANRRLERIANRDPLTGLVNRRRFLEILTEEKAKGDENPFAVLFLDLDNFKYVNDSLGHDYGDTLLKGVARRMKDAVRRDDVVARFGGDEFAIMLAGMSRREEAAQIAERIVHAMQKPFDLKGHPFTATVSVGVVGAWEAKTVEELLQCADTAMYYAKHGGKSRFCAYEPFMKEAAQSRLDLETELRRAWERREFKLFFQPIVDVRTGRTRGVETLIRWPHPSRGMISPAQFIPLAEELGLIVPIGAWVLEEACRLGHQWNTTIEHARDLYVAVNVSGLQVAVETFTSDILQIVESTGFDPTHLTLEVTETTVMTRLADKLHRLADLRAHGIKIAIDDFGTGYSSMGSLAELPVDVVKIDRSFVGLLGRDIEATAIMRAMVTLCKVLKLEVVAEGVETEDQFVQTETLGCDYVQGYFFGKPLPAEAITEWLGERRVVPGRAA